MATSVDVLIELKQEAESTGYTLNPALIAEINAVTSLFMQKEEKLVIHEGGPFVFTDSFKSKRNARRLASLC